MMMPVWAAIVLVGLQDPAGFRASAEEKSGKGDYKGAEADLSRAIELDSKDARLFLDRGNARFSLRNWDLAVDDYSRAIELTPGDAIPYLSRAYAKKHKGDRDGAEKDYSKAIDVNPTSPHGYAGRGELRENADNLDGALADFTKAIRFRTGNPQVYVSRGRIRFFQKKAYGSGMEDLDMAVRMAPKFPFGHLFRGFANFELDQNEEAIEDLTRSIELDPGFSTAYQVRAAARRNLGDRVGALADYSKEAELEPAGGGPLHGRGCVHFELGEWKKAIEDFQAGARLDPKLRDYAEFRIWICRARLGDREAATAQLGEYLQGRKPKEDGDWPGTVGAFLIQKISEKDFRAAAKTDGQRCEVAFYVGSLKLLDGARDAARDCFEECLKTRKRSFYEYSSAAAALDQLAPGRRRRDVVPGRMKIEVLHVPGACPALERDPVCKNADHWRFWVDEVEYLERERFFAEVHRQGKMELSELIEWSDRRTLLWAPAKAPFSRIAEALNACARAGIGDIPPITFHSDVDARPLPRDPKAAIPELERDVREEDLDVSLAWEKGTIRRRVGKSPWSDDDAELLAALRDAGVSTGRYVHLSPAPDVPYGQALRIHRLFRSWNLSRADFKVPFYRDPGPRPWGAVTADEAEKLARTLEEAAASGSAEAFDRAFAWQEILRRMIGDAELSARMQWLVEDTYRDLALSGKSLIKLAESTQPLKFLRMKTVDGAPRPLFRLLTKRAFDYVELELGKGSDGSVLILDVHRLSSDGSESRFLRRVCLPPKKHLEVLNVLKAPMPGDIASSYEHRWKLNDFVIEKKFEEALKFFDDNRAAFRNDPSGHRSHLIIAGQVGPEAYAKAVADLEEDLPNDSVLHLRRLDRAIVTGKYDQALVAVDDLEKVVGEDPYHLVLRAGFELLSGRARRAKELALEATGKEPSLDLAWWTLFKASVSAKDHASAVQSLKVLDGKLRFKLPDLTQAPGFEEFVQSSEYQAWLQSRQ